MEDNINSGSEKDYMKMENFDKVVEDKEEEPKNKNSFLSQKKNLIIISSILLLLIIIIIIILILLLSKEKDLCEKGDEEKCLSCSDKKGECSSCNPGYILSNGKCEQNYSFKAIYYTSSENEKIDLFYSLPSEIEKMIIDGKDVLPSKNYTFLTPGTHKLYVLMDISNCTSLSKMFFRIKSLKEIVFTKYFDTKNIIDMKGMFSSCESLSSIDMTYFDTQNVKDISSLFLLCSSLTSIDLKNIKTQNVTTMNSMFEGCKSLTSVELTHFDTTNVQDLKNMFSNCHSLTSVDISNFNTKNILYIRSLFSDCFSLKYINLPKFDSDKLLVMSYLFSGCSSLLH